MNLSRCQFLQGILAVAGAATLPSLPFDNNLLDAPVSDDVPFAYAILGGEYLPCKSMSLEMSYDLQPFSDSANYLPYADSYMSCTLTFEAPPSQALYSAYISGECHHIAIDVPGSGFTFSGDFVLTDFALLSDDDGEQCLVTAERVNNAAPRPLEFRITTV